MIDAAVALIASNQDRNVSPVNPEYNEAGGMGYLCDLIGKQLSQRVKYVKVFRGPNESGDQTPLQGLRAQLSEANTWLEGQPSAEKYAISFHTDSGGSHTFGLYGSDSGDGARLLASLVASTCFEELGTDYLTVGSTVAGIDFTSYLFNTMIKAPSVLIEVCSHVSAHDINKDRKSVV